MREFNLHSPSQQVASHLRDELLRGRWVGTMPGGPTLAKELGVDGKTVWAALKILEEEGLLIAHGAGRRREISLPDDLDAPSLRLAILDYEPLEQTEEWTVAMRQRLMEEGHNPFFTDKSLIELGMDVKRVARMVRKTSADAFVVGSGSREILEWFAKQDRPAFAMFGRRRGLPIAGVGPDHEAAGREVVKHLISLGHRRIVILVRAGNRIGGPSASERAIFEEMTSAGIPTSSYNLPDWEDSPEGLEVVMNELFRVTPPTALIVDEAILFHAVREHLAQRGIVAPAHVSLICTDPDRTFSWCRPTVAHIRWDHRAVVRRILRWTENVARGKEDRQQTLTKAEFVNGGTVGPPP